MLPITTMTCTTQRSPRQSSLNFLLAASTSNPILSATLQHTKRLHNLRLLRMNNEQSQLQQSRLNHNNALSYNSNNITSISLQAANMAKVRSMTAARHSLMNGTTTNSATTNTPTTTATTTNTSRSAINNALPTTATTIINERTVISNTTTNNTTNSNNSNHNIVANKIQLLRDKIKPSKLHKATMNRTTTTNGKIAYGFKNATNNNPRVVNGSNGSVVVHSTSSGSVVAPTTSNGSVVAPTTSNGSVVVPTTISSSGSVVAPTTSSSSVVVPTTISDSVVVVPTTISGSVVVPSTSSGSFVAPTTSNSSFVVPITSSSSVVVPTTSNGSVVVPMTSNCSVAPTTSSGSVVVPMTSGGSVVVPTTTNSDNYKGYFIPISATTPSDASSISRVHSSFPHHPLPTIARPIFHLPSSSSSSSTTKYISSTFTNIDPSSVSSDEIITSPCMISTMSSVHPTISNHNMTINNNDHSSTINNNNHNITINNNNDNITINNNNGIDDDGLVAVHNNKRVFTSLYYDTSHRNDETTKIGVEMMPVKRKLSILSHSEPLELILSSSSPSLTASVLLASSEVTSSSLSSVGCSSQCIDTTVPVSAPFHLD